MDEDEAKNDYGQRRADAAAAKRANGNEKNVRVNNKDFRDAKSPQ